MPRVDLPSLAMALMPTSTHLAYIFLPARRMQFRQRIYTNLRTVADLPGNGFIYFPDHPCYSSKNRLYMRATCPPLTVSRGQVPDYAVI